MSIGTQTANTPESGDARARARRLAGLAAAPIVFAVLTLAGGPRAAQTPLLTPRLVVGGYADGDAFRQPRGIAFDPRDGSIAVANTGAHRIEVFSASGRPLARFVHHVADANGLAIDGAPCALAFDRAGQLLVADLASNVVDVLDRRGRLLARLAVAEGRPSALAIGPDGTIFVGTSGELSRIYRFNPDYTASGSWGVTGSDPGQLLSVTALGVLPEGNLAVACARTREGIQVFTPAGQYLRGFASHELGRGSVSLPSGVFGSADGRIWVLDEIRQTVQVFSANGEFLDQGGGEGDAPGLFAHPSSMSTNGRGLIAITDRELGRFQILQISDIAAHAANP
jgi:DNA-binding beta-propeller fold protein YncE